MYEQMTYELLLERMLKKALETNGKLDAREGSLIWLGQAPAAVELQNLYIALDAILNETFADTASRDYLILRAAERGLSPRKATPAILEMTITPATLLLEMGERFSIGDLNYFVSKELGGGKYEIACEEAGEAGNDYAGTIIPIEYVEGLETCAVTALLVPGEDEEDTEVFRKRYFDGLNAQAFGGNQADYLEKINAISGVGGVKVYRAWNGDIRPAALIPPDGTGAWVEQVSAPDPVKGWLKTIFAAANDRKLTVGGTVKAVIIDSTFSAPSEALIDLVQTAVDPMENAGEGVGIAPIGHVVTVEGVLDEAVDLAFDLTYQNEWDWEAVKPYVLDTINGYFKELAETWADQNERLVVRISQLESRILSVSGVLDISNTAINEEAANYPLPLDHIPVVGAVIARG